jgi:hypothetical protein
VPERPKGTGCKPVGSAYGGSNPPAPTPAEDDNQVSANSVFSVFELLSSLAAAQERSRTVSIAARLSILRR